MTLVSNKMKSSVSKGKTLDQTTQKADLYSSCLFVAVFIPMTAFTHQYRVVSLALQY